MLDRCRGKPPLPDELDEVAKHLRHRQKRLHASFNASQLKPSGTFRCPYRVPGGDDNKDDCCFWSRSWSPGEAQPSRFELLRHLESAHGIAVTPNPKLVTARGAVHKVPNELRKHVCKVHLFADRRQQLVCLYCQTAVDAYDFVDHLRDEHQLVLSTTSGQHQQD